MIIWLLACRAGSLPLDDSPRPDSLRDSNGSPRDTAVDSVPEAPERPPFEHLPVFFIEADGAVGDGVKTAATLEVVERHDGSLGDLASAPRAFEGDIGIELHGSSSMYQAKPGFRFECRDESGDDDDCILARLPAGSDWILHAPYSDKTLVRNGLAYQLGRAVAGDARWEPRTQHVELFLDGKYQGVYLLVERVTREEERLDIPRTTAEDGAVAGGFIVKVDQHRSAGFDTALGTPLDWVEPRASEVSAEEASYLRGWFDQFEAALKADSSGAGWIDEAAWIDHWLVNELTHNIDAYRLSAYLWTDGPPGSSLLRAGPIWDFDRAFGNCNYCGSWTTEDWIYRSLADCGYAYQYPFWWEHLRQNPSFEAHLEARWAELRAGVLSDAALEAALDAQVAQVAEAEPRDHARWPTIGAYVDPNYYVGESYEAEVQWLRSWVIARAAWMDGQL